MATSVSVGDKVTTTAEYDVNGTHLAPFVRTNTYDVIQVGGRNHPDSRIVIGKGSAVTAAVDVSTLTVVGGSAPSSPSYTAPVVTPTVPVVVERVVYVEEDAMSSDGIEDALTKMLYSVQNDEILKYTMRLHGIPHQFSQYTDYRSYAVSAKSSKVATGIGRKFIENIMLEAPVVTIVPGKPLYLPAAKDKQGTSYALMSAANSSVSGLVVSKTIGENNALHEKMRYFDFQQDYYGYMKYVNILCSVAAAFLDIQDKEIDGVKLTKYDWKNYRWTADNYQRAVVNMFQQSKKSLENFVDGLKTYGQKLLDQFDSTTQDTAVDAFTDNDDSSLLEELEEVMTQMNFVQFYVDANSGLSESNDNNTASSKIEGILDSGSELFKEIAFLANSGGLDASSVQEYLDGAADSLTERLVGNNSGTISGVMSRILSTGSNVIKGDNMIFPEIYQNSKYNKNYSVSVDLRCPYGDKFSYFLNILVPLFHLICLAIPKQTTANTYGSPFIIKAYYPGIFSCNLGIVQSIVVDKNPNSDSLTVDGFPTTVKVTLNIVDLYSDLSMTPTGDVTLFLNNSSLIEYLATNCGVSLTTPQLINRVNMVKTVLTEAFGAIDDNIEQEIFGGLEDLIASITGV